MIAVKALTAFGVAQRLAAKALARTLESFVGGKDVDWSERYDAIDKLERALHCEAAEKLRAWIEEHIADRKDQVHLSDQLGLAVTEAKDTAYLYGVAIGIALARAPIADQHELTLTGRRS